MGTSCVVSCLGTGTNMNLLNTSCLLLPLLVASISAANNLVFKKIEVQMGALGSDDDIRIKICDGVLCCTTDKLSNLLTSEWVAKKKEKWDGGKLGNCSSVQFSDKLSSIGVIILKNDKFLPAPSVSVVAPKTNFNVNMVSVQIGDDGTDDDVSLEICSKGSTTDCCDTGKLDKRLRDDWKKKKLEKWEKKHLGACKTKTFDACKGFDVAVKKKAGKDTLKVTTITLEISDVEKSSVKKNFVCSDYNVGAKDTVIRRQCRLDSKSSLTCSPASKKSASSSLTTSTYLALLVVTVLTWTL